MGDLFDEVLPPNHRAQAEAAKRRRRLKRRVNLTIIILLVAGLVAAAYMFLPQYLGIEKSAKDYPGPGTGNVVVEIPDGATGRDMGAILQENGVVATAKAFADAFDNDPRAANIHSGFYNLRKEMSAAGAISALLDPASKADEKMTIPEGWTKGEVFEKLDSALKLPAGSSAAAAANVALPPEAMGDIEGWMAPLTYDFPPGTTPEEALTTMVNERINQLGELNIAPENWQKDLIKASILEREAVHPDDLPKVARVIENRLADTGEVQGKLQMDSTVLYGLGLVGGVPTTEQLAQDTPYNTYIHAGLPPTPIGAAGVDTLRAVASPAEGNWLYFVTVNLDSGETKFTADYDEHMTNVEELKTWIAANR
ncbi:MAG: endolytic transglycosylase MltG [Ancrocorticia sp.]